MTTATSQVRPGALAKALLLRDASEVANGAGPSARSAASCPLPAFPTYTAAGLQDLLDRLLHPTHLSLWPTTR